MVRNVSFFGIFCGVDDPVVLIVFSDCDCGEVFEIPLNMIKKASGSVLWCSKKKAVNRRKRVNYAIAGLY